MMKFFNLKVMTALFLAGFSFSAIAQDGLDELEKSVRPTPLAQSTAAEIYLSSDGDDDNEGLTLDGAVATLNKAFDRLGSSSGTIYVSGEILVSETVGDLVVGHAYVAAGANITIEGIEGTSPRLLGDRTARFFRLSGNNYLALKNLTLSGAQEPSTGGTDRYDGNGACINMSSGTLFAENVIFENFAPNLTNNNHGGAIQVEGISPIRPWILLSGCTFRGNLAMTGPSLRIYNFGDVNNVQLWVENCFFTANTSTSNQGGSAMFFRYGPSTVPANTPIITIVNTTVTGNTHTTNGDPGTIAMMSNDLTVNIINSTVKDNLGNAKGVMAQGTAVVNIYNSVLEGNVQRDIILTGAATANVYNSFINNTYGSPNYTRPDGYTANDLFDAFNPTTNSFTPKTNSLAIDFGNAAYLQAIDVDYDQLYIRRNFTNDKCDAGTVEISVTEWLGSTDNNWNVNENWTKGTPSIDYIATIPSDLSVYPVLTEDATAKELFVELGASIDLAGFELEVDSLQITTTLNTANEYISIGFPFAVNIYDAETELEIGSDYELQTLIAGATMSTFEDADAIVENTGYIWNWLINYGDTEFTLFSGATKIDGKNLIFDDTYRFQVNPNLATTSITLTGNEQIYKLNADGDKFEKAVGPVVVLAPYEAVITVNHADAASEISVANGVYNTDYQSNSINTIANDEVVISTEYYNLQGIKVSNMQPGELYIVKTTYESGNTKAVKQVTVK